MDEIKKVETHLLIDVPPGYREGERLDVYITSFIQNAKDTYLNTSLKQKNKHI